MKKVSPYALDLIFNGIISFYDFPATLTSIPTINDWESLTTMNNSEDIYDLIDMNPGSKEQIYGVIEKMMLPEYSNTTSDEEKSYLKQSLEYYLVLKPEVLKQILNSNQTLVEIEDPKEFFIMVWEVFFPGEKIDWDIKAEDYDEYPYSDESE